MALLGIAQFQETLVLSEGPLPHSSQLIDLLSKYADSSCRAAPLEADELTKQAHALTVHGLYYATRRGATPTETMALETWVLGTPKRAEARLASWFKGMPANYKILIHRFPEFIRGRRGGCTCWYDTHDRIKLKRRRTPGPGSGLLGPAYLLLSEMHAAYMQKPASLRALVEGSGHSFGYARLP